VTAPTPSQVHAELVRAAKKTTNEHWANSGGACPICKVPDCEARRVAITFLEEHSDPPAPIIRRTRPC
jgi:hypothetical protein